ncbi:hypothetical protein FHS21_003756 [Phyllobacterium trifolii]|uniref:Uncharacterized protein n=1 Tax=Phyllobacterium trifolii TaxID=300193 RepID=A0A839UEQ9_9HYPH|nr:hypothetical protein [Phyllobacterium trifolii]
MTTSPGGGWEVDLAGVNFANESDRTWGGANAL